MDFITYNIGVVLLYALCFYDIRYVKLLDKTADDEITTHLSIYIYGFCYLQHWRSFTLRAVFL